MENKVVGKEEKTKETTTKEIKDKKKMNGKIDKENKGVKKEKKVKKQKDNNESKKKVKKVKKRKLTKVAKFIIFISIVFFLVGFFIILVGMGIVELVPKNTGPKTYVLSEKVKVGDYVNYDAGMWEEDKSVPASAFTFGGYTKDLSRNNSVDCGYNPVDSSGWRVFSVKDDKVTLILNGISLCYYHGYGSNTNDKSVSILSGGDESVNFDYFLDENFGESVKVLSKEDVDEFYGEDTSYKRINNNIIELGNPYWLATKNGNYFMWYVTEGGSVAVDHVGNYGIRVLVTLKENVLTTGKNDDGLWLLFEDDKKDEQS